MTAALLPSLDLALAPPLPPEVLDVLAGRARSAVLCCDGFALAAALGDAAVGLVVGDLPYDEGTHDGARTDRKRVTMALPIDFAPLPPVPSFAWSLLRASRRWVICFCAVEQIGEYERATGEAYVRGGLWVRTNSTPQKTGDRPGQGAEGLAIMHRKGRKRWNGGGRPAVWTGPVCSDPTRRHPTKKPLWLMQALLRDFAEPGDIILDPTCGEGTTGEACMSLGLPFIGCEIDPKYHALAVARVARAERAGVQMHLPTRGPKAKQMSLIDTGSRR